MPNLRRHDPPRRRELANLREHLAEMGALDVDELDLCPGALREGVILRRLDWLDGIDRTAQPGRRPPRRTGRTAARGAR